MPQLSGHTLFGGAKLRFGLNLETKSPALTLRLPTCIKSLPDMASDLRWRYRNRRVAEPIARMRLCEFNEQCAFRIISQFNGKIERMAKRALHVRRTLPNSPAIRDTIDGDGS